MSIEPDHTPTLDEEITAYLDGELDASRPRRHRSAACAADDAARARLETLHAGRPPAEPFDLILDMAPFGPARGAARRREQAYCPVMEQLRRHAGARRCGSAPHPRRGDRLRAVAGLTPHPGGGGAELARRGRRLRCPLHAGDLRPRPADPEAYAPRLKIVGDGLGLALAPETVALPGLDLKGAILFHYDVQAAWAGLPICSTQYGPVTFCIIKKRPRRAAARLRGTARHKRRLLERRRPRLPIIGTMPREELGRSLTTQARAGSSSYHPSIPSDPGHSASVDGWR